MTKKEILVAIGEAIRKARVNRKRKVERLAELIGVSPAEWLKYEAGEIDMPVTQLARIAVALGVRTRTLVWVFRQNDPRKLLNKTE